MADYKDGQKKGAACLKAVSDLERTFQNHQPGVHLRPDEVSDFRFIFIFMLWFVAYVQCKMNKIVAIFEF